MLVNLSADLEYRALTVNDPECLLASPEDRLGRKMRDILTSGLMYRFDHCLYRARKNGTSSTYVYPVRGVIYRGTIFAPTSDTVLVNVIRVVGVAMSFI